MVSGAGIIADRLKGISGGRVLDVATGDGDFILALKQALGDYDSFVGIDVSREEIEKARENRTDAARAHGLHGQLAASPRRHWPRPGRDDARPEARRPLHRPGEFQRRGADGGAGVRDPQPQPGCRHR